MPTVQSALKTLTQQLPDGKPEFNCDDCSDTGWIESAETYRGRAGMVRCHCRTRKARERALAVIPAQYQAFRLDTVKPDLKRHRRQGEELSKIQAKPSGSFILCGDFGTGKSLMFWLLYRHAVESGRNCYGGTLRGLIDAFQKCFNAPEGEVILPPITAEDFRQSHTPRSLFLDDIDKARPTEYVAEQFFELLDAAHGFGHQIVATTNLRVPDLVSHFERADSTGRFGGSIVRRLLADAERIDLF